MTVFQSDQQSVVNLGPTKMYTGQRLSKEFKVWYLYAYLVDHYLL